MAVYGSELFAVSLNPSNLSFPSTTAYENYDITRNDSDVDTGTVSDSDHGVSVIADFWTLANFENLRQSVGWSIAMVIAYLSILIIGTKGNILVILVIILKPPMRPVTNMFLFNLAVSDLLVTVFCVPATLLSNLFRPWVLGSSMCKGVAYVQGVSVCASAYSLAAVSLDRCKAIYRPMDRQKGISKHQAIMIILLIWIFSLLVTSPWLFSFEALKSEEDGQVYCIEVWQSELHGKIYFLVANLLFCFLVPLTIVCISNIAIWCHVSNREVPEDSDTVRRIHERTRYSVMKTLVTVTSAFVISWLPLYVIATCMKFSLLEAFGEWGGKVLSFLLPCAQWLGSANSSMNPVLYAFVNSKFRKGFQNLFRSLICKDHNINMKRERNYRCGSHKMLRRQNAIRRRIPCHNRIEFGKVSNANASTLPREDV